MSPLAAVLDSDEARNIRNTFGAALIGAFISMILYGLTCLQSYVYFTSYPKDSSNLKITVGSTWLLDTIHTVLVAICMYHYLIINYSNSPALAVTTWSLPVSVAVNATIALIVNFFFVVRIFRLCSDKWRWWVTTLTSVVSVAHFAFAIETVTFILNKKDLDTLDEKDIQLEAATPFAVTAILSNLLITTALCCLLHGNRTGFKRTDTIVTTLIAYALHRCVLIFLIATAETIAYKTAPHDLWWIAIDFSVGKLYSNSLLTTLNSRASIRALREDAESIHISRLMFSDTTTSHVQNQRDPPKKNSIHEMVPRSVKSQETPTSGTSHTTESITIRNSSAGSHVVGTSK